MRIFNKSLSYTLNAVIYLADHSDDGLILSSEIAKSEKIPYHYLAKILQRLSKYGYIESTKGKHGGFRKTEKGLNSSVSVIMKQIDGSSPKKECILINGKCLGKSPCALHKYWDEIEKSMQDSLLQLKIKNLKTKKW